MAVGGSLSGWRVLVTRPIEQAAPLVDALREAGAEPIAYPTIAVAPPPSWKAFDAAVTRLRASDDGRAAYDWIVFTSPSATRLALDRAPELASLLGVPGAPGVAAVGSGTAGALVARGVRVTLVPADQRQEGLVAELARMRPGARVLFPQAVGGRELLRDALARAGAIVDVVAVSRTIALDGLAAPPPFDVAIFASPSALRSFVAGPGAAALAEKVVAVIGPTTREAARKVGVPVHVMAATPSVAGLVAALGAHSVHRARG